jgi:hypothetical protein
MVSIKVLGYSPGVIIPSTITSEGFAYGTVTDSVSEADFDSTSRLKLEEIKMDKLTISTNMIVFRKVIIASPLQ